MQIATELFGAKGAPEMTQAIREGRLSLDDISASLSSYSGVVDATFENTQDATDQAKVAMNNLKLAGTELASSAFAALAPVLISLVEKLQGLVKWFSSLDDGTKKTIVTILGVVAAVGPVLVIVGKVISAIGTIISVISSLGSILPAVSGAVAAFNAVCAANPYVLIIAAIIAVIAIFVVLWNKCEAFRNFWKGLWDGIKNVVSTAVEGIKAFFGKVIDFVKNNWQALLLMLVNPFAGA